MRALSLAIATLIVTSAAPASAAVVVIARDVDFATTPFTFGVTATDRFTFSFNAREQFDPDPVLVSTAGTAAVTTFFGEPAVFFTRANILVGPDIFPGFNPVPVPTRARFTLVESDLGLRFTVGADNFFGFARFAGPNLSLVAFENQANTAIRAGAIAPVPEPVTWAMMLVGFAAVGYSMRRRGVSRLAAA